MTANYLLAMAILSWALPPTRSFLTGRANPWIRARCSALSSHSATVVNTNWMREGFLISSFSDGLQPNNKARGLLHQAILRGDQIYQQQTVETKLEASVLASPCNGPNVELLNQLEDLDESCPTTLDMIRVVYIPTALYALRPESKSTPGKQRQRARYDAKQRRNKVVDYLKHYNTTVQIVTLDLDDGSIKHPQAVYCDNTSESSPDPLFPMNGKEALREWNPHLLFVQGGNTFWLYHCIEKGEWAEDLQTVVQSSVYCGASAGAIVAGASVETATWKGWDDPSIVPGRETYQDWHNVPGLQLVPEAYFPHYEAKWSNLVKEKSSELIGRAEIDVRCLADDQVCYVNGETRTVRLL